jgi:hypothetical protein
MSVSEISLLLTNDWELYGEGSGNFYELQSHRLSEMLMVLEKFGAKLTLFAEVGQQWAHLNAAASALPTSQKFAQIAQQWLLCLQGSIQRGHDVQLHYHPTWKNAAHDGSSWKLDLSNWALKDLGVKEALADLQRGREYLNRIGQEVREDYQCLAFRAGAFCLQPIDQTLPILREAGLVADSSILPGAWDYLYFDYRNVPTQLGPFGLKSSGQIVSPEGANLSSTVLLELPIHTERVWDSPIIRRLLPMSFGVRWHFGVKSDPIYKAWARARDIKLAELSPHGDPLGSRRRLSKMNMQNWLGYMLRRSAYVLDYDFMQPDLFVALIKTALRRAEKQGFEGELPLVALGHMNNSHSAENIERILLALNKEFGAKLTFSTFQETINKIMTPKKRLIEHKIENLNH